MATLRPTMSKPRIKPKLPAASATAAERVQKVLARLGLGSRREIETWIRAGRVACNGVTLTLGARVSLGQDVTLDGRTIKLKATRPAAPRVWLLNKPAGTVCTRRDPEGRPTVYALLPSAERRQFVAVGRLDFNTTGLLLFTDDGDLAHRLMHPRFRVPREYAVRIFGEVPPDALARMVAGVTLEGEHLAFEAVARHSGGGTNEWYTCRLRTGRNREVRRLWEVVGCTVSRLIRTGFGNLQLARRLPAGQYREATPAELATLYALVDLKPASTAPESAPPRLTRTRAQRARLLHAD